MDRRIIAFLLSLITTFFLIVRFNVTSIISIVILLLSFIFIFYSINHIKKKYNKKSIILSIILSVIYVICDSIESTYMINIFNKYLLLNLSGYFIIFYFSITNIFAFMDKIIRKNDEERKIYIGSKEILTDSKFSFVVNFSLIFIVSLIFLIKFYPGNLTYDSYNELMQTKGIIPLMNNHSILHTSILMLFVKFGLLFKSVNLGVFLYSLFQIIIVSLVFSYILYFMAKQKVPMIFRIISIFFFAFHPINVFYSISVWKDVFFSLCFAVFTILVYYLTNDKNYFKNRKNIVVFMIFSILLMYLRNNGIYVVIISLILLAIINRDSYKRVLPIFIGIVTIFFASKILIFNMLNIKDFEIKETLSFPSQSIARIYKYDKKDLSSKDIKQIELFYSNKIGEVYNPIVSDNTKNELNQKYLLKHRGEYLKLNLRLFLKHNKRYLESFISNNYGYYYINTYYPSIILQTNDELGIKHIEADSLFILLFLVLILTLVLLIVLWNLKEKKNILLLGLLIPVIISMSTSIRDNVLISLLFNIGFYVTITFLTLIYNIINKKNIVYYIPIIILWISILFSPVYAEFRYLYSLFILVPVFVGITFKKADE
ncbi:MAG: hypothetical protein J6O56_01495 [Bacilli bacterium]|nr:hypothetical protein [Bacilli bacterium]